MSKVVDIKEDIKWIGIKDPDLVTFDIVMETQYGTTYNSYFINADKKAIVETAKLKFKDQYLEKVKAVTDPSEISYIILDHTEPDHSGCVAPLLELAPDAEVVGSRQAITYMKDMIDKPFKSIIVKDGDTLDLGNKTLRFISAPNLHWPDSIYTYLEEDKILFTCDSFGAHFCSESIFDDEVEDYSDSFTYYFDVILKPFSKFMLKAIEKIRPLEIDMICTGHGPVLRSKWKEAVDKSERLSQEYLEHATKEKPHLLIAYVSAYGFTKEIAELIAQTIHDHNPNLVTEMVDIENIPIGDLESKIIKSNAFLIGSPTINQNTLLPVYKMFALLNPIRDKGKKAAAFGSYGWSGEAVKIIEDHLRNLKLKVIDGMGAKFYPNNSKVEDIIQFAKSFSTEIA